MSKKLYVGNLPFSVNNEKLKELFSKYGDIEEAQVVSFRDTGRSKGFGFVTFINDADADKAKEEMNGKDIEGRELRINDATPFDPSAAKKPRFNRDRGFGNRRSFNRNRDY